MYLGSLKSFNNLWKEYFTPLITRLFDLSITIKIIKTGWFSKEKINQFDPNKLSITWNGLDKGKSISGIKELDYKILNFLCSKNSLTGLELKGVDWFKVDSWSALKNLLCNSGLFDTFKDHELHLVESDSNYVFKAEGKHISLFGINNLVIVDTKDHLLIGTPESLHENL